MPMELGRQGVGERVERGAEQRGERLNTRAAGVVTLAVLCSRVLGLVRDQVYAALFGGGALMDAFTTAFRVPNLLRDLFAEGALSMAFVTTFSKTVTSGGHEAAWRLANKVATLTAVVLSVICVAGIIFSPQLVALIAPGFEKIPDKAALAVLLTRIMFPFILMVSLAALVMGMLNARNVFGMPALASSFFNVGSIVGGVLLGYWFDPHFGRLGLIGFAIGILIGGALQLCVQLPSLWRLGYRYRPDFHWRDPGVRAILGLMGPSVIAASTTQFNVFINSIFASDLGNGPIFWLSIAFRLMQLPLGLFGVALGTVTLPLLSRLVARGELHSFRTELSRGMRLAFLLTLPSTVGLMMLAGPIMSVLYQHGRLDTYQAMQAAGALRYYAVGLAGYAALKVLVNAFYALDRRKTPMLVSFVAVLLNLLFNWLFTFHLGWGVQGLAFSTGCVASCNFLVLYWLMRRQLTRLETRRMALMLLKVSVACVALAAVCWGSNQTLLAHWPVQRFLPKATALLITVLGGAFVFFLSGLALRVEELQDLFGMLRRRLKLA
ncbi:MAG TPA: murein biosynthesis integral membrane protein MurJ [Steroidobacteraceae bacterium]|jgi:putative peptidoglycan lipid II flippase|nr:murein biosynthesis integral membrane protein MurJ [Steroidobacteraceae bacterium]